MDKISVDTSKLAWKISITIPTSDSVGIESAEEIPPLKKNPWKPWSEIFLRQTGRGVCYAYADNCGTISPSRTINSFICYRNAIRYVGYHFACSGLNVCFTDHSKIVSAAKRHVERLMTLNVYSSQSLIDRSNLSIGDMAIYHIHRIIQFGVFSFSCTIHFFKRGLQKD